MSPSGVERKWRGRLLPQFCRPHTPWPTSSTSLPHPFSRSQKTWTSNSGYRIYSVSLLSHGLSTIKRDFHERQECRENDNRFAPMFLGTREGLFPTTFAKKKKKVSGYILVEEKKKEKWRVGGTIKVLEAFLIQNFIEGQK